MPAEGRAAAPPSKSYCTNLPSSGPSLISRSASGHSCRQYRAGSTQHTRQREAVHEMPGQLSRSRPAAAVRRGRSYVQESLVGGAKGGAQVAAVRPASLAAAAGLNRLRECRLTRPKGCRAHEEPRPSLEGPPQPLPLVLPLPLAPTLLLLALVVFEVAADAVSCEASCRHRNEGWLRRIGGGNFHAGGGRSGRGERGGSRSTSGGRS